MKRTLSYDPITGKKTTYHSTPDGDFTQTEMNVSPILESAKTEANAWRYGSMIGNTQAHQQKVAEIPAPLYHQLVQKFGQPRDNPSDWKKWLNERENRFFRTTGGKV